MFIVSTQMAELQRNAAVERTKHNCIIAIEMKRYYCKKCDRVYRDITQLNKHLKSKKHTGNYILYNCELVLPNGKLCSFSTRDKSEYRIHLTRKKHTQKISVKEINV